MATIIDRDMLPHSATSHRFEGQEYGEADVSFFLTDAPPGTGPRLHTHPYAEVFVILGVIATGALAALFSLIRRERPLVIPALGLITNAALIVLFWWLQFYAPGFHQDNWAPRPF